MQNTQAEGLYQEYKTLIENNHHQHHMDSTLQNIQNKFNALINHINEEHTHRTTKMN